MVSLLLLLLLVVVGHPYSLSWRIVAMAGGRGGGLLLLVPAPTDVNSAIGLRRGCRWLVHGLIRR